MLDAKAAELSRMEQNKGLEENKLYDLARSECIAEMCETMLSDTDAAARVSRQLQAQDKGLWNKTKGFFKGLVERLKKAYAGMTPDSAIARQTKRLITQNEAIRNAWVDAVSDSVVNYQLQDGQKKNAQEGVKYSSRTVNGENVVWIEDSGLTSKQLRDHQAVANYIAEHVGEVYTIIESGSKIYLGEELPSEYTHSKYTSYLQNRDRTKLKAKNKAIDGLGEMIEIATNRRWEKTKHPHSKDAAFGMYRYDSKFAFPVKDSSGNNVGAKAYDVELLIRNASDGKKYLYDIVGIKENTANVLELQKREHRKGNTNAAAQSDVSTDTLSQDNKSVKKLFSTRTQQDKQLDRLAAQNEKLRQETEYLRQLVQIQKSGNKDYVLDRNSVKQEAKALMDSVNAKGVTEFSGLLNDFYRQLTTEDMDIETMTNRAGELADWLLDHHTPERDSYAQEVLDFLAKRRVSLSDGQIGDIEYSYGSLSDFMRTATPGRT